MPAEAACGDGVGEDKKPSVGTDGRVEAFDQEPDLVGQHRVEAGAAHIALAGPVNRVAERHVVGRNCFGDRAGGAARGKKPPRDLLPRADLRKGPVEPPVHIDLKSLLPHMLIHSLCHGAGPYHMRSSAGKQRTATRGQDPGKQGAVSIFPRPGGDTGTMPARVPDSSDRL